MIVKEREKDTSGDKVEFAIPKEGIRKICYSIGGKRIEANVASDKRTIRGSHIKSSKIVDGKYHVEFDQKLDKGDNFSRCS